MIDAFGPDEGFWIGVVVIDIELDGLDEIGDTCEGSASDAFSCDFSKPTLDKVKPRGTRWDKVQIEARMFLYPAFNAGMLMGCVIVNDEVQVEPRRGLTIYLAQEFEELFMAMAIETFSDNGSLKHVERCEKRRRAVANIVVSHGSATPALEGQSGLGAIQSLDL